MIKDILDILKMNNFYGVSKSMDIAKGKYQIPKTYSDLKNLFKRM
jgi:hypothetical protein